MPKAFPQYSYRQQAVARARQVFRNLLRKKLASKRSTIGAVSRLVSTNRAFAPTFPWRKSPFIGPVQRRFPKRTSRPQKRFTFSAWKK